MPDPIRWNDRYRQGDTPWDTGQPSSELQRVVAEVPIPPGRALELGCGTGTNAIWLAQQGFDVTALDLSALAVEKARQRAAKAGVRFLACDVTQPPAEVTGPFDFCFDRGCYHAVRRENAQGYVAALRRLTHPGSLALILAGNAREPHDPGPPVVTEEDLRREFGIGFSIVHLREFYFDPVPGQPRHLAWSCLLRRSPE